MSQTYHQANAEASEGGGCLKFGIASVFFMSAIAMTTTRQVGNALDRVLQSPAEELSPPNPPPSAENGVDEETEPNLGKVAFRAGRAGGERGIRTLDGITPKPSVPIGPRRGIRGIPREF